MAVVQQTTKFGRIFWPVLAWTVAIVFFFPIFWMVFTSFKTDADAVKPEYLLFFTPTLENYLNMTENYDYWRFAVNSVITSVFATAFTLAVGVPAAYALARNPGRTSRIIEEFISLPLAIPGLALALALLQLYGTMQGFRTSWTFILVGHVLYTLPFMVRSVLAVLAAIDLRTLEEGAATLGAGPARRFVDVVVPNALPGILAGALTVVTLSIGEFNLTWMLHTPYLKTLPVGLADSYASMRLEIASAYTLVFFVMIVPLLMAMQWASARAQRIAS